MCELTDPLDEREQRLWREYERQEEAGLRRPALGTLAVFIDAVRAYPPARRKAWVEAACRAHWDDYDPIGVGWNPRRICHPLAVKLIFPELVEGYRNCEPNYARWLGQFTTSLAIRGAGLVPPDSVEDMYFELRDLGLGKSSRLTYCGRRSRSTRRIPVRLTP